MGSKRSVSSIALGMRDGSATRAAPRSLRALIGPKPKVIADDVWAKLLWAGLNLFYLVAALRGWLISRLGVAGIFVISFILLRSFFLSSLENPEPRYVLECFPVVLALAGGALALPRMWRAIIN